MRMYQESLVQLRRFKLWCTTTSPEGHKSRHNNACALINTKPDFSLSQLYTLLTSLDYFTWFRERIYSSPYIVCLLCLVMMWLIMTLHSLLYFVALSNKKCKAWKLINCNSRSLLLVWIIEINISLLLALSRLIRSSVIRRGLLITWSPCIVYFYRHNLIISTHTLSLILSKVSS